MKIRIFENGIRINYADDLPKVVKFFKDKVNLDIEFTAPVKTNVLLKDCPANLYLPNDNSQHDILMYIFDRRQRNNSSSVNFSMTLKCIEISTSIEDDAVDYTWKLISHEIMHTFFQRLRNMNIFLDDPMDSMIVNGIVTPYYKNEEPYASDGNFAEAFKRLAPHWTKLFPLPPQEINYFKVQEFVPRSIYQQYGENSRWFISPQLWSLANFVRRFFNKPVTINNWHVGGNLDQRGFRDPESTVGARLSQHRLKSAIDINVAGMPPKQVYDAILANSKAFMDAGLTCMEDIADTPGWNHLDIRWTGEQHIKIVKP